MTIGAFMRVDPAAASCFHGLVVTLHELRPIQTIGASLMTAVASRSPSSATAITEIEIFAFNDLIVVEHQTAKSRMLFHCPNDRPGNHRLKARERCHRRVSLPRRALANRVPAGVDLQIRRNHAPKLARDRGRKRGFTRSRSADCGWSTAGVARARGDFRMRPPSVDRPVRLASVRIVPSSCPISTVCIDLGLPFAHRAGKRTIRSGKPPCRFRLRKVRHQARCGLRRCFSNATTLAERIPSPMIGTTIFCRAARSV